MPARAPSIVVSSQTLDPPTSRPRRKTGSALPTASMSVPAKVGTSRRRAPYRVSLDHSTIKVSRKISTDATAPITAQSTLKSPPAKDTVTHRRYIGPAPVCMSIIDVPSVYDM